MVTLIASCSFPSIFPYNGVPSVNLLVYSCVGEMEALQGLLRASLGEEEERAYVTEWTSGRDAHVE